MSTADRYAVSNITEGIETYINLYYLPLNKNWELFTSIKLFPFAEYSAPVWSRLNIFSLKVQE